MPIIDSLDMSSHSVAIRYVILASGKQILHIDAAIYSLLGYVAKNFLDTTLCFTTLIHTADQNIVKALFSFEVQETPKNINIRCRHKNGKIICLQGRYYKKYSQNTELILHLQLTDAKLLKQAQNDQVLLSSFTAMLDKTEDYIYFKDRNHVFTAASQTLVSLTSPSEHWRDLIGKTDYDVFEEEYADAYYQLEKDVFAGASSVQKIQKTQDKQGNIGWVDNRKYPILNKQGDIIGLFGIARDITENIANQQTVQKLLSEQRSILESSLIASVIVKNRKIIWANPAYAKLFGYSISESISMPTRRLYADEATYQLVGKAYESLDKEPIRLNELKFLCKNGQIVWGNLGGALLNEQDGLSLWSFIDITELRHAKLTLQNSEIRFRTLFESHGDAIVLLDEEGLFSCNNATLEMFGCATVEELCALKDPARLSPPVQPCGTKSSELAQKFIETAREQKYLSFEWMHKRYDNGRVFAAEVLLVSLFLDGKQIIQGIVRDISERKKIEHDLRIAAVAFESKEGVIVTDSQGVILKVNHAFSRITGYSATEAIGNNPSILQSRRHNKNFYAEMWQQLETARAWEGEIWNKRKNGDVFPEYLSIAAVQDASGNISNYVASFHDVTQEKAAAIKIERLAFYDSLTNLPNRRLLLDRLDHALTASARNGGQGALLFIDLDNFKLLNDTHGHDMGDLLLQQVATRLLSCIRKNDTVARLGGDEFVVMLENLSKIELEAAKWTKAIANKILSTLNKPYFLGDKSHYSTPSIGVTLFGHRQSMEELLKHADIAMYDAKASGRNTVRFFDQQMQFAMTARAVLEEDLHQGLQASHFKLHYQAQVNDNNRVVGVEAFIRWQHPQRGLLEPYEFMAVAEESGSIIAVGDWVLYEVCEQLKCWENSPARQALQITINISNSQFRQADFASHVTHVLSDAQINPSRLRLELTEQIVVDGGDDAMIKMQSLQKIGVHFAIGNFGLGYSSLASLKKLPIDQIKLDKSFVHDIGNDPDNDIIVQAVIAMAKSLKIELIAEGVETVQQHQFLIQHGCQFFQGYLFSKPDTITEFEKTV